MPRFRFTLGKYLDTTNVVTNGTFNSNLNGWTVSDSWVWWDTYSPGNGKAVLLGPLGGGAHTLTQSNVFEKGEKYRINFTMGQYGGLTDGIALLKFKIGGVGLNGINMFSPNGGTLTETSYSYDRYAQDTDLQFIGNVDDN